MARREILILIEESSERSRLGLPSRLRLPAPSKETREKPRKKTETWKEREKRLSGRVGDSGRLIEEKPSVKRRGLPSRPLLTPNERRLRSVTRQKTYLAIRNGKLVNPRKCEKCGVEKYLIEANHRNYNDYMDVEWLCRDCSEPGRQEKIREYKRAIGWVPIAEERKKKKTR